MMAAKWLLVVVACICLTIASSTDIPCDHEILIGGGQLGSLPSSAKVIYENLFSDARNALNLERWLVPFNQTKSFRFLLELKESVVCEKKSITITKFSVVVEYAEAVSIRVGGVEILRQELHGDFNVNSETDVSYEGNVFELTVNSTADHVYLYAMELKACCVSPLSYVPTVLNYASEEAYMFIYRDIKTGRTMNARHAMRLSPMKHFSVTAKVEQEFVLDFKVLEPCLAGPWLVTRISITVEGISRLRITANQAIIATKVPTDATDNAFNIDTYFYYNNFQILLLSSKSTLDLSDVSVEVLCAADTTTALPPTTTGS